MIPIRPKKNLLSTKKTLEIQTKKTTNKKIKMPNNETNDPIDEIQFNNAYASG
jgi:hypothetical protein